MGELILVRHGQANSGATTEEEYAIAIHTALTMSSKEDKLMRYNAQVSSQRFSDDVFDETFGKTILPLLFGNNNNKENEDNNDRNNDDNSNKKSN